MANDNLSSNGAAAAAAGSGSGRTSGSARSPRPAARSAASAQPVKATPAGPQPSTPLRGTVAERRYSFHMLVATALVAFVAGRLCSR